MEDLKGENNTPIVSKHGIPNPLNFLNNTEELKDSVKFLYEKFPELKNIGTKEKYMEYIQTVFPESCYKEIVFHNSDKEFLNEGFKPKEANFDTLNSIPGAYNFSTNRKFIQRYGKNTYSVVLNIEDPVVEENSGEYIDDMDRPLSEALLKIGIQSEENSFGPQAQIEYKNKDAFINSISGEYYVKEHPISGREFGIPKQSIVSVFDANNIHILGSQKDLNGFKNFINMVD